MIGTILGTAALSFYCLYPATSPLSSIVLIAALSATLKLLLVSATPPAWRMQ